MPQIPLFEPIPVSDYRRENYLTSVCNAHILETVQAWLVSDEKMLTICGSEGSGKSHLAHVIMEISGIESALISGDISELKKFPTLQSQKDNVSGNIGRQATGLYVLDPIAVGQDNPRNLLDLIEDCRAACHRLLLVGQGTPSDWAGGLKDLLTRLEAMPRIDMPEPDEALMRKVIARQMKTRQFSLDEDGILALANYAAQRLPRTHAAAYQFTRGLDILALSEKKKPGQSLARQVIELMDKQRAERI